MRPADSITTLRTLVDDGAAEERLQCYLESHPWLVTRRGLHPRVVIAKPPLGADFRPDFAYFWSESNGSFLELLEIEAPSLAVFTAGDEFSARFNHALQQLADWADWCDRNRDGLMRLLEPLFHAHGFPMFTRIRTRLIAGRRAAVRANPRRLKRWEARCNEIDARRIRTWDGFVETCIAEAGIENRALTCVAYREQRFVPVPPVP